ncbi:MAG: agmatinase [Bdellovibrionia bacterium]
MSEKSHEYKPLDGRQFPRFSGIKTFFRLPIADPGDDFDIGIVGVPFDGGVSYRPGARFAPSQIREVSSLGRGFNWSRAINFFEKVKVADLGDCPTVPVDQAKTYERIQKYFAALLKKEKKFIGVGGDHSITLPLLRETAKAHGKLSLIHFDAHLDTYPAAWDCEYHHGTFARHAIEEGLIDPKQSLQIGLRGPLAGSDDLAFAKKHGLRGITVDDIRDDFKKTLASLPKFDKNPVYISFDIDCLDPAYAPGTGTPVPGGLTTYETQRILRALKIKNFVAGDVVEVSPPFDQSQITALAAVDVIFEFLCLFASK